MLDHESIYTLDQFQCWTHSYVLLPVHVLFSPPELQLALSPLYHIGEPGCKALPKTGYSCRSIRNLSATMSSTHKLTFRNPFRQTYSSILPHPRLPLPLPPFFNFFILQPASALQRHYLIRLQLASFPSFFDLGLGHRISEDEKRTRGQPQLRSSE